MSDGCGINNEASYENIREQLQNQVREKFRREKPGYPSDCWVNDVYEDHFIATVDEKLWDMKYTMKGDQAILSDSKPKEVVRSIEYKPVSNERKPASSSAGKLVSNKEADVTLTTNERKKIIDDLITNCSCSWKEEDREILNAMDEAMLAKCKQMMDGIKAAEGKEKETQNKIKELELVANAAREGFSDGNAQWKLNDKCEWVKREKEGTVTNQQTTQAKKPQTMDDWLEIAPEEVVAAFNQVKNFSESRKQELIQQITANKFNTYSEEELASYDLDDVVVNGRRIPGLQTIADRLTDQADARPVSPPSFLGAAVGNQAATFARRQHKPEPMPSVDQQWDHIFNEHRKTMKLA